MSGALLGKVLQHFGWRVEAIDNSIGEACRPMDLGEAYEKQWHGVPSLFVLSTGRVGTETLTALLNLSSDIDACHEPQPRLTKASYDAYMESQESPDLDTWKPRLLAARDDMIISATARSKIYAETNNRLTYLARPLSRLLPDSKFIHLYRHPYDVIRSGMRRGFYRNHPWDFCRVRPRRCDVAYDRWDRFSPLEKVAWYWARINEESLHFLENLPDSRGYSLASEALFDGETETVETLFRFAGARPPCQSDVKRVLGFKMNAQRSGDFPRPEEWSDEQLKQVNVIVNDVACRLGYPLDL